jgi:hypothetical protein
VTGTGGTTGSRLCDKAVARLVKQAARATRLDSERCSGHSLRAWLAKLVRETHHTSTEVALGYLRPADPWRNNVTERVFRKKSEEE